MRLAGRRPGLSRRPIFTRAAGERGMMPMMPVASAVCFCVVAAIIGGGVGIATEVSRLNANRSAHVILILQLTRTIEAMTHAIRSRR